MARWVVTKLSANVRLATESPLPRIPFLIQKPLILPGDLDRTDEHDDDGELLLLLDAHLSNSFFA